MDVWGFDSEFEDQWDVFVFFPNILLILGRKEGGGLEFDIRVIFPTILIFWW